MYFANHYVFTVSLWFIGVLVRRSYEICIPGYGQCNSNYLYSNHIDIVEENNIEDCMRECDGNVKLCYIKLHVEPYSTMGPACGNCPSNKTACLDPQCITADGVEKGVLVFNRMIPGPAIQVCQGDRIVVDLINSDGHRSTSVHWHGIRQISTPHSDGVPYVTQCPINPGETFRYRFIAEEDGSFFYHSHSGVQKIDGLAGPLVVRKEKSKEIFGHLYDFDLFEHIVFIQDWVHGVADQMVPGLRTGPYSGSLPRSYLINGRGIYVGSTSDPYDLTSMAFSPSQPPISEFVVKQGRRYRFRIISSTCLACTVRITIQGHRMTLIHADGAGSINPTEVDAVTLNSGDRFDVIIEAKNKIDSYWILARGVGPCNSSMQLAVLKYEGAYKAPNSNLPLDNPHGVTLNPTNPTCNKSTEMCLTQLSAPVPAPPQVVNEKCPRLLLQFGFHFYAKSELFQSGTYNPFFEPADTLLVRAQINSITNRFAPSPLLSQYNDIPDEAFCDRKCHEEDVECTCLNVYKVKLGTVVDLIIADTAKYDRNGLMHPFHLHGYNFYVLKEGVFSNGMKQGLREINKWLDNEGMMTRPDAIKKDTIGIPSGGYAVIRLVADNPGFWIFHCHFTLHLDLGMSAVLQVGEVDQMPQPPTGFPKCGNFLPPIIF
ncbi:hypothetical protein O3M35_000082 [Rhynocoris fuscipes]|uniref:Uncharacterized protein n=1 Tax=Rhynocoris fuscipes TaxID=488301 RepID=A0AAW1DL33_9HEMI